MVEALIFKLCLNETQFEEYKEQHFSDYAVYATYEEENLETEPQCFYIQVERWQNFNLNTPPKVIGGVLQFSKNVPNNRTAKPLNTAGQLALFQS